LDYLENRLIPSFFLFPKSEYIMWEGQGLWINR